jgi:hypothetical protein
VATSVVPHLHQEHSNIPIEVKEESTRDGVIVVALRYELQRRYPSLSEEDASRMARTYKTRASKLFDAMF